LREALGADNLFFDKQIRIGDDDVSLNGRLESDGWHVTARSQSQNMNLKFRLTRSLTQEQAVEQAVGYVTSKAGPQFPAITDEQIRICERLACTDRNAAFVFYLQARLPEDIADRFLEMGAAGNDMGIHALAAVKASQSLECAPFKLRLGEVLVLGKKGRANPTSRSKHPRPSRAWTGHPPLTGQNHFLHRFHFDLGLTIDTSPVSEGTHPMGKLQDKVAVITGGTSGMALATAKLFVEEGAYVFITGRRQQKLDEAVKAIGKNVTGVQGDASNLSDLDRLEPALERRVLFDVLPVLVERRGADAAQLAARQRRFEQVGRVPGTCRSTRTLGVSVLAPRSSGAPPGGIAISVLTGKSATASRRPVSAPSAACRAKRLYCPLCCSRRPTKKFAATSAPMTTRAKMASASAMPRSSLLRRPVMATLRCAESPARSDRPRAAALRRPTSLPQR
jgi:hypothetical protein